MVDSHSIPRGRYVWRSVRLPGGAIGVTIGVLVDLTAAEEAEGAVADVTTVDGRGGLSADVVRGARVGKFAEGVKCSDLGKPIQSRSISVPRSFASRINRSSAGGSTLANLVGLRHQHIH